MKSAPTRLPGKSAFTIIELLVVIAILGILMALTLPAFSSLQQSSDLTRGGQLVADQINLARQIAAARNKVVEVRFIKLPGRDGPGYSGVQLWASDSTGGMKAERGVAPLPTSVAIIPDPPQTSAISKLPKSTMPAQPAATANAEYTSLQIRPSGIITPTLDMKDLFLTVAAARTAGNAQRPENYVVLQLNPLTGSPLVYRP